MLKFKNFIGEAHDPKHIKQAIGIASDPRYKQGNMTGAVKAMNKLSPGIHNHPQVAAVLKRQNEGKGLWHNIHKKRKEGRPMRKPGEKGAPTTADFKAAQGEETKVNEISKGKARKYIGYAARDVFNLGRRDQAASDIGRLGGKHPDQDYQKGPERKAAKRVSGIDRATKILMKKSKKESHDWKKAAQADADKKAYADFFKRGGKITKLPPGKAQGWHGKSDPGAGMKGMLAKGSAKKLGLKKHGKHLDTSTPVHKDEGKKWKK